MLKDDERTVEELVQGALHETDEEASWQFVAALHWRGNEQVLAYATKLALSPIARERRLAADVLGQLGVPVRSFPEETCCLLMKMLEQENDDAVLQAIYIAFSHLNDSRFTSLVRRDIGNADSEVRRAIVLALSGHENQECVELLILLSKDKESSVRDWATFGMGTQIDWDSPQLRDALLARLNDEDEDTRAEAHFGLALRKDQRGIPALIEELGGSSVGDVLLEAAQELGSPLLYPSLLSLKENADGEDLTLDAALAACKGETK